MKRSPARTQPAAFRLRLSPMTTSVLLLFVLFTASSCYTAKKMDKWIDKQYGEVPQKIKSNDYIHINTGSLPVSDRLSDTRKGDRKLIPALVYYKWDYSTVSTLNPQIPASHLSAALLPYANTKGLRKKLNGQTLELTLEKMPSVFSFRDKGVMIFLLLAYTGWEQISIEPKQEEMVVSYRLLKDGKETRKGTISIPNRDRPVTQRVLQSTRKMTGLYLEQYNNNIRSMSKELVDRLLLEVQLQENYASQ
ncbi:hypothetical protein V9K67_09295 [Paraflavisolibacter sp. H34]|uniref:hypothetical protein n=1 Tax=Huijunlia imazamoxiresistens TaxID=3127457 RepID=UPI00301B6838